MTNKLRAKAAQQRTEAPASRGIEETFKGEKISRLVADIPVDLHRRAKVRALEKDIKLRELVIEALEAELSRP